MAARDSTASDGDARRSLDERDRGVSGLCSRLRRAGCAARLRCRCGHCQLHAWASRLCGWRGDPTSLSRCGKQPGGTTDSTPRRGLRTASRRTSVLAKNISQASERGKQRRSQTKGPAILPKSQSNFSSSKPRLRRSHQRKKKVWNAKAFIVWHRWRNWPPQQGTRRHPHQKKLFPDSCKKARRWKDASPGAPAST